ncbi:MAG: MBL fold metallo-hydrolase [Synergistaceae bacterium]|nr:MBL fold metallo-hydrolase [Synergistaceae bacterium]
MKKIDNFSYPENFIKYLGTSGGRFSMIRQCRSTGGLWFRYGGLNGVIDPGSGCLVRICAAYPPLESDAVDMIILTHKHIDHSTDANVLIECMTHGGFEERGLLVAPDDALNGDDPVVMKYSRKKASRVEIPRDGELIALGNGVTAEPVTHLHHGVDCFGYIFRKEGLAEWGIIGDTRMMEHFSRRYANCDLISINTTFPNRKLRLDHTSVEEVRELLQELHPKTTILTHLGAMLTSEEGAPFLIDLDTERTHVVAATDGMVVDLDDMSIYGEEEKPRPETRYYRC